MLNSMRQNSYFAFQIFKVKSILPFIKLSQNFLLLVLTDVYRIALKFDSNK